MKFTTHRLNENFRSGRAICRAANNLISHNLDAGVTDMVAMRDFEGDVSTRIFNDERAEESFVVNHVADLIQPDNVIEAAIEGWKKPTVAILCRYQINGELQKWADAFEKAGFKTSMRKAGDKMPEGWQALRTTLSFFAEPENNYLALRFMESIDYPNPAQAKAAAVLARKSINQMWLNFPLDPATDPVTLKSFLDAKSAVPLATVDWFCEQLKNHPAGLSMSDISALLIEYETAGQEKFDESADVCISTIHGVKGMEFGHVVCPGWNEGFFPRGNDQIEEARRLAYIGITRAKDSVLITASRSRWTRFNGIMRDVAPSRFIEEIK